MILNDKILNLLYKESYKALNSGEIPVSAVIVDESGKIVSFGRNNRQFKYNVLGHAEINAILKAEKKLKDWRLDGYTLIVTLEPCSMCSMVIKESRIDNVYYFLSSKNREVNDFGINKKKINDYPEFEAKFSELLTVFFNDKR